MNIIYYPVHLVTDMHVKITIPYIKLTFYILTLRHTSKITYIFDINTITEAFSWVHVVKVDF